MVKTFAVKERANGSVRLLTPKCVGNENLIKIKVTYNKDGKPTKLEQLDNDGTPIVVVNDVKKLSRKEEMLLDIVRKNSSICLNPALQLIRLYQLGTAC